MSERSSRNASCTHERGDTSGKQHRASMLTCTAAAAACCCCGVMTGMTPQPSSLAAYCSLMKALMV